VLQLPAFNYLINKTDNTVLILVAFTATCFGPEWVIVRLTFDKSTSKKGYTIASAKN
jgi:hypothetical protein